MSETTSPFPSSRYASLATQSVLSVNGPMLARVCITDYRGTILLDMLSYPSAAVQDYYTETTGLRPEHFTQSGHVTNFENIRNLSANLLSNKIVVGYKLWYSFEALKVSHPAINTRDLATYHPLMTSVESEEEDLQALVFRYMRRQIRGGYINPVEDARAAIDLFRSCELEWEAIIASDIWPSLLPPPTYAPCYS